MPDQARKVAAQFGQALREARHAAGLSQEQLAQRAGMHWSALARHERGARDPRLDTIVRLARGLGVTPSELVARAERPR